MSTINMKVLRLLELPVEQILDPNKILVEFYSENDYLMRPSDTDDSIIVVLRGSIAVCIVVRVQC